MFYKIAVPLENATDTILNFASVHVRFALGHEENYIDIAIINNIPSPIAIEVGLLLTCALVFGLFFIRKKRPVGYNHCFK